MKNGEVRRRHDAVVNAIGQVAWQVGAQVVREVEGLDPNSRQRPDLQIAFPPATFTVSSIPFPSTSFASATLFLRLWRCCSPP